MQSSTRNPSRHPFRHGGHDKVYRLHGWEKTLLVFAGALLIFQPWALGGMRLWSQYIAAALALLAFVSALIPRHYTDLHHAGGDLRLIMWPRLLRFPFFWLGLVYFGYVLIQIYNPAWQFFRLGNAWAVMPIKHITWLPHGVADAPIEMMNGWRTLLIQVTPWLLVCALWVGITRRKSVIILLTTFALNGTVIAIIALLQRLLGADKLLWIFNIKPTAYVSPVIPFFSSFVYKNHAGAYLVLILATCLGLAWWYMTQASRNFRKSHPGMLFAFTALTVFTALAFSYARAATALGGLLLLLTGIAYLHRWVSKGSSGAPRLITVLMSLLGAGFLVLCVGSLNTKEIWERFGRLTEEDQLSSITSRQLATLATIDMAKDSFLFGHGAGNFRYIFPKYQKLYPEITSKAYRKGKGYITRYLYWEHAHNDYAELFAEAGLIGLALLAGTAILVVVSIRRYGTHRHSPLLILLAGPALIMVHAGIDFPAHNPAVLVSACALTALVIRWAQVQKLNATHD